MKKVVIIVLTMFLSVVAYSQVEFRIVKDSCKSDKPLCAQSVSQPNHSALTDSLFKKFGEYGITSFKNDSARLAWLDIYFRSDLFTIKTMDLEKEGKTSVILINKGITHEEANVISNLIKEYKRLKYNK